MKRTLYDSLLAWKTDKRRKPLLLQGARQVGKTYLVSEFGRSEYKDFVYLNFEQTPGLSQLFRGELSPNKIMTNISLFLGRKITSKDTLLFFDEIQSESNVLVSLKYFQEQTPDYHIIAAGSLLGVSIGKETSFPVGKVNFMTMYPLSFTEYLRASGENAIAEILQDTTAIEPFAEIIHHKLLAHLKMYMFLGGMPEVVREYIENKDITVAREIQLEILEAYQRDFPKYADTNQAIKTAEVWNSIPYQLAKERKKFKYSDVSKNSRAATYEASIEWLSKAGLIHKANNISTPRQPLAGYADGSKFKIYLHDTGLLGAMLNVAAATIIEPTALFTEYNGAFTENLVATQLIYNNIKNLYYWTSNSDAEVDFIVETSKAIYPVEVKGGLSKNKKSIRSYAEKYKPLKIFRLSPRNFVRQDDFINLPLYAINQLSAIDKL